MVDRMMMAATESPNASTGTTLRACQNCSRSKAKCIPQTEPANEKCARCFRLAKECFFPPRSARKRRHIHANTSTAKLEEKIENLTTLLASQQQVVHRSILTPETQGPGESTSNLPQANNTNASLRNQEVLSHSCKATWGTQVSIQPNLEASSSATFATTANGMRPLSRPPVRANPQARNHVQLKKGDDLLSIFREQFSPRFPFIIIPPNLSSSELQAQKPWLHKAITVVASQGNRTRQLELAKEIASEVALAMLLRSERSLDMLESLIIFNAWFYFFSPTSPQSSSSAIIQLAIALVFDLALNRPVRDFDIPAEILNETSRLFPENNVRDAKRSAEDRRALLSMYFLTSMYSWCLKKIEGLQYSPYIEYCCQALLEAAEYESDIILVALVRVQSIIETANRNLLSRGRPGEKAPVWMHVKSSQFELQTYWNSLPPNVQQNRILLTNYYCAELALLEPSLQKSFFPTTLGAGNSQRLDMLYTCLTSAKLFLDYCLNEPLAAYFTFCGVDLTQLGHGLSILFKLSLVDEVGWDLVNVRQTVNFASYFEKFYTNFEQVGIAIDQNQPSPCNDSFHTGCARKMKKAKGWFDAKVAAEVQSSGFQDMAAFLDMEDVLNSGYFNDSFWEELMAEGGFIQ